MKSKNWRRSTTSSDMFTCLYICYYTFVVFEWQQNDDDDGDGDDIIRNVVRDVVHNKKVQYIRAQCLEHNNYSKQASVLIYSVIKSLQLEAVRHVNKCSGQFLV